MNAQPELTLQEELIATIQWLVSGQVYLHVDDYGGKDVPCKQAQHHAAYCLVMNLLSSEQPSAFEQFLEQANHGDKEAFLYCTLHLYNVCHIKGKQQLFEDFFNYCNEKQKTMVANGSTQGELLDKVWAFVFHHAIHKSEGGVPLLEEYVDFYNKMQLFAIKEQLAVDLPSTYDAKSRNKL